MKNKSVVKEQVNTRLVNYSKLPKILISLWTKEYIGSSAYCFYLYLIHICTFNSIKVKTIHHGLVKFTKKEVASTLPYTSKTVYNWLEDLEAINAISFSEEGYIIINNYDNIIHKAGTTFHKNNNQLETLSKFFSIVSKKNSKDRKKNSTKFTKISSENNTNHLSKAKHTSNSINSYKCNISLYEQRIGKVKSEEEHKKLAREYDTTVEDLKLMEECILNATPVNKEKGL